MCTLLESRSLLIFTDDIWLLMFLRTAKFSQLRAREILTGYMTCKTEVAPEWYNGTDTADPKIMAFLDSGSVIIILLHLYPQCADHFDSRLFICHSNNTPLGPHDA